MIHDSWLLKKPPKKQHIHDYHSVVPFCNQNYLYLLFRFNIRVTFWIFAGGHFPHRLQNFSIGPGRSAECPRSVHAFRLARWAGHWTGFGEFGHEWKSIERLAPRPDCLDQKTLFKLGGWNLSGSESSRDKRVPWPLGPIRFCVTWAEKQRQPSPCTSFTCYLRRLQSGTCVWPFADSILRSPFRAFCNGVV